MSGVKRKAIPTEVPSGKHHKARPLYLKVRLPKTYENLLPDLLLFDVADVAYVRQNSPNSSYLYAITSCVLDRSPDEIQLWVTTDGSDAEDDEEVWSVVANDETEYESGVYVCYPIVSAFDSISVEKVVRDTGDLTPRTNSNASSFRTQLVIRDAACVVTETNSYAAKASHLIPQHLLNAARDVGGVVTGDYTFLDPYDPRVGVLVCPDIEHHIDRFDAGFFVQGSDIIFHIFRTSVLYSSKHFAPTAWKMQHENAKITLDAPMREVLAWHYKHCLILSWGGVDLISYSRNFPIADGKMVALSKDMEDYESELSSPASSANDFAVLSDVAYCNTIV